MDGDVWMRRVLGSQMLNLQSSSFLFHQESNVQLGLGT